MQRKINKKVILPVVLLLIISIILIAGYVGKSYVTGEMEAVIIPEIAETSGKIIEMRVELGQVVKEGDVLAVISSDKQEYTIEQLELNLKQAELKSKSAVANESGAISSAQSAYSNAKLAYQNASEAYEKRQQLYKAGAISENELEQAQLAVSTAEKGVTAGKAALESARAAYAQENSELSIDMTQNQLDEAKEAFEKCIIRASSDGTIITKSYNKGNIIAEGYNILEIAQSNKGLMTAYVPYDSISKIEYGKVLQVKYDGQSYDGRVVYVDVKKQYTPRDMQTAATRAKKNFKIKLELPSECKIKPGETAKIKLP